MITLEKLRADYKELYGKETKSEDIQWLIGKIDEANEKGVDKKHIEPIGLERVYFDTKNGIQSREVLKETSDGTFVCWDEEAEAPIPFRRADYKRQEGGFWGTEKEAAESAIKRMTEYVKEIEEEIIVFKTLI